MRPFEIIEIPLGADAPPLHRRFRISDPDTHLSFEITGVETLNIAHYEDIDRHVPVKLLNGQAADAFIELAARLNRARMFSTLPE